MNRMASASHHVASVFAKVSKLPLIISSMSWEVIAEGLKSTQAMMRDDAVLCALSFTDTGEVHCQRHLHGQQRGRVRAGGSRVQERQTALTQHSTRHMELCVVFQALWSCDCGARDVKSRSDTFPQLAAVACR